MAVTVEVRWADATRAADASQAAYFRGTLADERQVVATGLADAREQLRAFTEGPKAVGFRGMARARSRVRDLEHQLRKLDRLIAALDRRFGALWSHRA
jgi:hypothetical protein